MDSNFCRSAGRAPSPVIIWTNQRTGGTNLTKHLFQSFRLKRCQHEPFNKARQYGNITRDWLRLGDEQKLHSAVQGVCQSRVSIKHCVEQVPWEVSQALAMASHELGFRHLLLFRRDAVARLLSREYARRTGIWGRSHLSKAAADRRIFWRKLDVDALVEHERQCRDLLNRAAQTLMDLGARTVPLAYEDVYGEEAAIARAALTPVFETFGLDYSQQEVELFVEKVRKAGHQGTRDRYQLFRGQAELARRLQALRPLFDP